MFTIYVYIICIYVCYEVIYFIVIIFGTGEMVNLMSQSLDSCLEGIYLCKGECHL